MQLSMISNDIIRLDCNNKETANNLVKTQPLEGLKCFVPFVAKYCVGVIRDMDTYLSEADIKTMFSGVFNRVLRMNRFNRETKQREATGSVKVIMECDQLPEYVAVYGWRCKVHEFMERVRMCFKCHNFGHHEAKCKSQKRKCLNCGGSCDGKCNQKRNCSSCNSEEHCFGKEYSL